MGVSFALLRLRLDPQRREGGEAYGLRCRMRVAPRRLVRPAHRRMRAREDADPAVDLRRCAEERELPSPPTHLLDDEPSGVHRADTAIDEDRWVFDLLLVEPMLKIGSVGRPVARDASDA